MPSNVAPALSPGTLAGSEQPVLTCPELILRPWRPLDVDCVVRAYSQSDIQQWHGHWMDRAEAEAWVRERSCSWVQERGADWAVTGPGGSLLGRVGLNRINLAAGLAEVAYWVLPEARGRAVASRALCAITDWAFARAGFHRLELAHSVINLASCRVAQAAAYELEGTKRKEGRHRDGWHDMHLHARLAGDQRR